MSKIICEICGTSYHDSAERCPICGFSHVTGRMEDIAEERKRQIFDFDEVNPEEEPLETLVFEDGAEEEEHHPNVLLVVLLVIIITLLLSAVAFLYFRFYLPNNRAEAPNTEPAQVMETEAATETTELQIPCQSLTLTSGVTELNREGQLWLLHVTVLPEDTTDPLVFYSEDESVVTVTEGGRLEAIGEGETYVHIICGDKQLRCRVVVRYEAETVPTEETLPVGVEVSEETIPAEELPVVSEPSPTDASAEIVLKLKDSDRSSNKRGVSFDLQLDCDLKPEDVTWLTLDSQVAIVRNGTVTTIGPGSTKIIAQYKGQQVECIIRCNFS